MYILAYFEDTDGAPEGGLFPTMDGCRIEDNKKVLSAVALTEAAITGWYFYNHSTYDSFYHYVYTVDSVTLTGALRYAAGASGGDSADIATLATNLDTVSDDIKNQYYAFRDMRRKNPEWNPNQKDKENEQR